MSLGATENDSASEIHIPAEIDWHMLDKSKFFFLGAALFSGVSAALYPVVVLKTRQQVSPTQISSLKLSFSILHHEALEVTKSSVGTATVRLGFSDTQATAIANAAAGLSSAMAAQLVWTPIDVVSQRLMVQGCNNSKDIIPSLNSCGYRNGIDAFRKILHADGPRGLYRGFGISILTYAPSNAVWWASYSVAHRLVWVGIAGSTNKREESSVYGGRCGYRPDSKAMVAVQGLCAVMASGVSAMITMPLDTIKTRMQVLDGEQNGRTQPLTVTQTVKNLVKEGGFAACFRGLGPRWVSMSMSATTMITTYEFLKRLSTKSRESFS
ncbi:hypothetical protein GH714_037297 [Hevea brasiliensis]|uniref:Mitochondrial carrier protein n=1 Tax=Hevea brasiliensis TaxID=3981 RepID=A0A6A6KF57_HEVBR|nr:hypothetical protein GH714_037297 [Hevea brasiliensis]